MWFLYLAIVVLSGMAVAFLVGSINDEVMKLHVKGRVRERLAGGVLLLLGAMLLLRSMPCYQMSGSTR